MPVDLLPDREGKTLEEWLKAHPGVEVVTRDRSSVYANAITTACPTAMQVADRWHLLKNLSENVGKLLDAERSLIKEAAEELSRKEAEELKSHPSDQSSPLPPDRGSTFNLCKLPLLQLLLAKLLPLKNAMSNSKRLNSFSSRVIPLRGLPAIWVFPATQHENICARRALSLKLK